MYSFNKKATKIFDLGAVIINIQPEKTFTHLKSLLKKQYQNKESENIFAPLFMDLEKGILEIEELHEKLLPFFQNPPDLKEFLNIWNGMLLDIPQHRINTLLKLKEQEEIYLLSNTNREHIQQINTYLKKEFNIDGLNGIFTHCFLSYEMALRKPNAEIYEECLAQLIVKHSEFVFFDDTEENVIGSKNAGLPAVHVPNNKNDDFWNYLSSQ